jgi:hypothetical protein
MELKKITEIMQSGVLSLNFELKLDISQTLKFLSERPI